MDPDQFFIEASEKYEIDRPKNLYDTKMRVEWYQKLCTDHPLVTYIEDGIRVGDVAGWQQFKAGMATKHGYVQIGINKWFKSDLSLIKQFTQMVTKPSDSDNEEQQDEEVKSTSEVLEPPVDPNSLKFIPDMIHLSK